jgi:hypothetical protein
VLYKLDKMILLMAGGRNVTWGIRHLAVTEALVPCKV